MKLQFDPSQAYQLDAISTVVDLFDGQPVAGDLSELKAFTLGNPFTGQRCMDLGPMMNRAI